MKKLALLVLCCLSLNVWADNTEKECVPFVETKRNHWLDINYVEDLDFIDDQKINHQQIEKNIHRQPRLPDYFSYAVRNKEILLSPYPDVSQSEVESLVNSMKERLQFDSVKYDIGVKHGQQDKVLNIHLVYSCHPSWMKSNRIGF